MKSLRFILFSLTLLVGLLNAGHVPGDNITIQSGINDAANGATVLVADETRVETSNVNLVLDGKAIDLMKLFKIRIISGLKLLFPDGANIVKKSRFDIKNSIISNTISGLKLSLTAGDTNIANKDRFYIKNIGVSDSKPLENDAKSLKIKSSTITGDGITTNTISGLKLSLTVGDTVGKKISSRKDVDKVLDAKKQNIKIHQ